MSEKLNWAEWRLERSKGGVEMKGLKEFIEDLAKDNKLREKFKDLKDVKEIVSLAKKEGYEFTEDEYMDKQMENVSGGFKIGNFEIDDNEWRKAMESTKDWIENERRATQPQLSLLTKFKGADKK